MVAWAEFFRVGYRGVHPPFSRPPIYIAYFATSFAKASSYAKASADQTAVKTAVKKATIGRKAAKGRIIRESFRGLIFRSLLGSVLSD